MSDFVLQRIYLQSVYSSTRLCLGIRAGSLVLMHMLSLKGRDADYGEMHTCAATNRVAGQTACLQVA